MESGRAQITRASTLSKLLARFTQVFPRRSKTHDYTRYQMGVDYIFESIDSSRASMTGNGRGVRQGDYLILQAQGSATQYQVEEIDYYSSPSNLWIALLIKI